jgi:tetratricopeptide (TPR) repeat protein
VARRLAARCAPFQPVHNPMAAAQPTPGSSRIEIEVLRARALLKDRRFEESLAVAQSLLQQVPENRDVLYLAAVSQRYLGRVADALKTLARFEALHPDFGRLYQEIGHCYRAVGELEAAINAYQQAIARNHTLSASWSSLRDLYRLQGRNADSENAAAFVAKIAKLPHEVVFATNLFLEGELFAAEQAVRQFLLTHGDHIEGMRLLAQIGIKLEILDDAEFLLESVLAFAPDYTAARFEYACVLVKRQKYPLLLAEANKLLRLDPLSRDYRTVYASACVGLGKYDEALRIYSELLEKDPQAAELQLSIAHVLKTLGRQPEAIASYRAAAAMKPSFGDAYWSLANLKTYRFTDGEIARMREYEAGAATSPEDRFHLCFALGKAFEDRADYAESFRYYERGNAFKKAESSYRAGLVERNTRLQRQVCTREFFAARRSTGCDRPDPIFIVGLPRAGSTLLEQIIASHSQVEGTMELSEIPRLVHQLQGRGADDANPLYPAVLAKLDTDQLRTFGERYIKDTQMFRSGKPYFIDKMPNNFRHVGLIHLILPNAKIIDARRDPMACCFSNFKQLFAAGQEFTYSMEDIARYYRTYVELMAHWDDVLPGRVLRVLHEDVVEDLEGNVRRILEYCGLEFEPRCIEFYKTERSVRTASSEQVRQPIYREGLDQWRNFEPWLGPLKDQLGELVRV